MQTIKDKIRNSPFRRSCYTVDIGIQDIHKSIMLYLDDEKHNEVGFNKSDIFLYTPDFQRDNDKWTEAMQISFVENILMGCRSTLMLYEVVPEGGYSGLCTCKILDGLQRLTAIHRFITGEIQVFGRYFTDFKEQRVINSLTRIQLSIYTFCSEKEAIEFYISMNENITHSTEDIEKAKRILNKL